MHPYLLLSLKVEQPIKSSVVISKLQILIIIYILYQDFTIILVQSINF